MLSGHLSEAHRLSGYAHPLTALQLHGLLAALLRAIQRNCSLDQWRERLNFLLHCLSLSAESLSQALSALAHAAGVFGT